MSLFKKYKLNELVAKANTGLDAIKRAPIVEHDTGIKCLRIQDVSQSKEFKDWGFTEVTKENYERFSLKEGEIILARTGNTIGVNMFIGKNLKSVFNNGLIRLRTNKEICDPKYLYYNMQTTSYWSHIDSIAFGTSTQPNMQIESFLGYEIEMPDLPIQTRIASILSALDDIIELNRRTNHTLEQMAQTLFKKYFVTDIDPDKLPEGWRWGKIGEMIELVYGKSLKEENRKGGKYPVVGSSGIVGYHNEFIADANGIVVGRKGNAGSVIWLHENFFPIDTTFYVSDLLNVNSKHYYYLLLNTFDLGSLNSDSAVPGLNRNEAHKQNTIIPDKTFIENFNKLVEPLFEMIKIREKEISNLTKVRDSLLPKLMSGEITVN